MIIYKQIHSICCNQFGFSLQNKKYYNKKLVNKALRTAIHLCSINFDNDNNIIKYFAVKEYMISRAAYLYKREINSNVKYANSVLEIKKQIKPIVVEYYNKKNHEQKTF